MRVLSRRSILAAALAASLPASAAFAADNPKTINIDWATYNPVSMVLKEKGLLEKEFAKDGIGIRWVQTLGSNKALEFLSAGSIDFGSTAGSAALSTRNTGRLMEADLASPPSAQARGSTHRSLAAFFKRPQAALLKSALFLFYMIPVIAGQTDINNVYLLVCSIIFLMPNPPREQHFVADTLSC